MFYRPYLLTILTILVAALFSFSVAANANKPHTPGLDTIILENATNVSSAVAEIQSELEKQGFSIPLIVNHSAAAKSVDLKLDPSQVIFARPPRFLENRLLRKSNTVGLDLPIKFLVFEDKNGEINLSVNTLGYLIDRHKVHIRDFVLRMADKFIEQYNTTNGDSRQGVVSMESFQSIEDTVQALQDTISSNQAVRMPLVLNYGKSRHSSPVLIVFGNPNVGTPLMQVDPRIGIDLPLKFLVWKDQKGQVNISYNDPHYIAGRINIQGQDTRLDAIANTLKTLALTAAGGKQ